MNSVGNISKKIKEGFIGQRMIVLPPNIKKIVLRNALINRFYLTDMGFYPHAVNHDRERKAGCHQYILLYCIEGKGTIYLPGNTIELVPNTFFIIPRQVPHHYKSSQEDPWSIYWVHFMGEAADHLTARYYQDKSSLVSIPYDEKRMQDFEEIFSMLESSFDEKQLEIANIKLFNYISSFVYFKEINPSYQEDDVISDSIAFMKRNLSRMLTLEQLAKQQHLSVSQYSRLFKTKMGSSPNQYFSQLKIQKSCQYLYFSDRNIKEICAELGFQDPYYFSRLFKKLMGKSPAFYKNQHKKS
ncbi:MAG TPA: AraC family transcriptional regulator [Chitinophaga sp.]|uniref:AraC family transcriptional regulator n=1 Tax=Chitinophaga sp. TaxID=1869181 RepID=UPI002F949D07